MIRHLGISPRERSLFNLNERQKCGRQGWSADDWIWVKEDGADNPIQDIAQRRPSRASPAEPGWRRSSTVTPRIWWSVWELPVMNSSGFMRRHRRMFK